MLSVRAADSLRFLVGTPGALSPSMGTSLRIAFLGSGVLLWSGCTTLGPMPATTGISLAPAGRPEVELRAGLTPGYYLSSAAAEQAQGASMQDLAAVLEPDRLLGVEGLFVAGRYAGTPSQGAAVEPAVGYRAGLGEASPVSVGVVGYGTHANGAQKGASFSATRGGLEAGGDLRLTPKSDWLELHLNASAALTGLSAHGHYCIDAAGDFGVDCPDGVEASTSADVAGVYPSASGGLALDLLRHRASVFHGVRLALDASGGTMPRLIAAEQRSARLYGAAGFSIGVAFGAR